MRERREKGNHVGAHRDAPRANQKRWLFLILIFLGSAISCTVSQQAIDPQSCLSRSEDEIAFTWLFASGGPALHVCWLDVFHDEMAYTELNGETCFRFSDSGFLPALNKLLDRHREFLKAKAHDFDDVNDCAHIVIYDEIKDESYILYDPDIYVFHDFQEEEIVELYAVFGSIYSLLKRYAPQFNPDDYFARLFSLTENKMQDQIQNEIVEAKRRYSTMHD